jgi:hypothetical protein
MMRPESIMKESGRKACGKDDNFSDAEKMLI